MASIQSRAQQATTPEEFCINSVELKQVQLWLDGKNTKVGLCVQEINLLLKHYYIFRHT